MINIKDITTAIESRLKVNTTLMALGCTVERSVRINYDPGRCPWVGIYPGIVDTLPKAMSGRKWVDTLEPQIVIQAQSMTDDGTEASDMLEDAIDATLEELGGEGKDLSLGLAGVRILGFSREYRYVVFDTDGSGQLFMPQAIVRVKIEARS